MSKGRKIRSEEAEDLLRKWKASGEPMSTWCEKRGLNWYSLSAFKSWSGSRSDIGFAEVVTKQTPPVTACGGAARYRIEFGDVTVVLDDDFRAETLQRLLRAVAAC